MLNQQNEYVVVGPLNQQNEYVVVGPLGLELVLAWQPIAPMFCLSAL